MATSFLMKLVDSTFRHILSGSPTCSPIQKMDVRLPFQVETTRLSTAEREGRKWPIRFHRNNAMEPGRTWIFTDGGGGGRFAAAIVRPSVEEHRITGCRETLANSVVAELDGVILGLENTVLGERVTVVSDYLWTAYYVNGWWKVHHACLREGVIRARKVIEDQTLKDIVFLHYGGENADDECEFSQWNKIAHDLCQEGVQLNNRTRLTPRSCTSADDHG